VPWTCPTAPGCPPRGRVMTRRRRRRKNFVQALASVPNALPRFVCDPATAADRTGAFLEWNDPQTRFHVERLARVLWHFARPAEEPHPDAYWLVQGAYDFFSREVLTTGPIAVACVMSGLRVELRGQRQLRVWADFSALLPFARNLSFFLPRDTPLDDDALTEIFGHDRFDSLRFAWPITPRHRVRLPQPPVSISSSHKARSQPQPKKEFRPCRF